jgi:4-oxalocrotonate tautomerase
MPLIEVHLIEKVFSPEQKRQIIQKLTDAMVSIEGENMRGVTRVKISEVTSGERGVGDKPLATDAVKELAPKCGWVLPETPIKRLLREVQQPAPGDWPGTTPTFHDRQP